MPLATHKTTKFEVKETPLGSVLMPYTPPTEPALPAWATRAQLAFPRIPYLLFLQIAKWQTEIAETHKSESATSLFLVDGQWQAICFHQSNRNNSMTIDVDLDPETAPENAALAAVQDRSLMQIHATLHNHVNGAAGQSGTDEKDELNLFGPHITIGNLNMNQMSFHARLSVWLDGKHQFIPLHFCDIIDVPVPPGAPPSVLDELAKAFLNVDRKLVSDYPEEWKGRYTEKKYVAHQQQQIGFHTGSTGTYSSGTGSLGTDEEIEAWINDKRIGQQTLEDVYDQLPEWPSEVLMAYDFTDLEAFIKSVRNSSSILQEACIAICYKLKYKSLKELYTAMTTAEPLTTEQA